MSEFISSAKRRIGRTAIKTKQSRTGVRQDGTQVAEGRKPVSIGAEGVRGQIRLRRQGRGNVAAVLHGDVGITGRFRRRYALARLNE